MGDRNKHFHGWEKKPKVDKPLKGQLQSAAVNTGRMGAEAVTDIIWRSTGLHVETSKGSKVATAETQAKVEGFKCLNAKAGAGVAKTFAGASANPTQAKASAGACGPNAEASAALVEGLIEANSEAFVGKAHATAGFGIEKLGAHAEAEVVTARVAIGIAHTPLKAHAQGPAAGAETGISWDYTGASAGASLGEARAGPFAARAGFKIGAGIRNGVPEVDIGMVTVPCSII